MLKIKEAVVVEGKYDKIKLSSIFDAVIIETNGFGIFKDKEKREMIRLYARTVGIVIVTDSDSAGFKIRNYIKGFVNNGNIKNVYMPDILGKEKRKEAPSGEGKLGVEGIDKDIIIKCFNRAGVLYNKSDEEHEKITREDFFEDGLIGKNESSYLREKLKIKLQLPKHLSTSGMLEALNVMLSKEKYSDLIKTIKTDIR